MQTQQNYYELRGTYPLIAPILVQGVIGSNFPFTEIATPYGVVRQCAEDIRIVNNARDVALGFEAIAPIERGQAVENVAPFVATIAEHTKDEIWFSNGTVTFAFNFVGGTWRMLGVGLNAIYYEDDTGVIQAATATNVVSMEAEGVFTDLGSPIAIEWQTPSVMINSGMQTLVQRAYFHINTQNQKVTPVVLVDDAEYTYPVIETADSQIVEMPIQKSGRRIGFRFTGNLTQRVFLAGVDWDDQL